MCQIEKKKLRQWKENNNYTSYFPVKLYSTVRIHNIYVYFSPNVDHFEIFNVLF